MEDYSRQQRALNLQFQFENNKLSTSIKSYARKAGYGLVATLSSRLSLSRSLSMSRRLTVLGFFGRQTGPVYSYLIYARHDQATPVGTATASASASLCQGNRFKKGEQWPS